MSAEITVPHPCRRGRTRIRRAHRRPIAAAAAVAALLAASGCSAFVTPKDRQPTPPHATETWTQARPTSPGGASATRPAPGRPGDEAVILAAYNRFWVVAQTVDAQPQPRWRPLLADVAADPLLSELLDGYQTQAAQGLRQFGLIQTRPVIASHNERAASIADCQDASRSGLLDSFTGLPSMVGSARTSLAATLARGGDGRWRVNQARYLPDPC